MRKGKKDIKVVTMDTETRGFQGDIFRAGMFDGKDYYESTDIQDLLNIIKSWSEIYYVHVYIHNLNFDLRKFAMNILSQEELHFRDMLFINNNVVTFPVGNVVYHDSYRILSSSLERLCKSFGLEESDAKVNLDEYMAQEGYEDKEDFFMRVPDDDPVLRHYLRMDCESLYTVLSLTLDSTGLEWNDFVKCPTAASIAMKVYRTQFPEDAKLALCTYWGTEYARKVENFIRTAYRGGRVEVFIPRLLGGHHYDVNSLYPYVMKVNDFPYGSYRMNDGVKARMIWNMRQKKKGFMGFIEASVTIPKALWIPPLPVNRDGKLLFPTGNIRDVWTFDELENAMKYGVKIIDVHTTVHFEKKAPVFRDFVETFQELKMNSTGAKREFAKVMQNSLYGKFGTGRIKEKWYGVEDIPELEEDGIVFKRRRNRTLGLDFVTASSEIDAKYIQPHLAAYVTSYARILLYNSIMAQVEQGERVAYCDTDSMATTGTLPDDMVDDKEYGKWKLEHDLDRALFLQPKLYYERSIDGHEIKKGKGIPKDILNSWTEQTYEDILQAKKNGDDEFHLYDQLPQLPKFGSLLKNDLPMESIRMIRKSLNLLAEEKRVMDYMNNDSYAHTYYDF